MIERLSDRVATLITVGLIIVYLAGTAWLAVTYDRRFFMNDAVSITVWLTLGIGLALLGRQAARKL